MRKTGSAGIALIKDFEKFSPVPYNDAAGFPTIAWGHLIRQGEHFTRVDDAQGAQLLEEDLAEAEGIVNRAVKVPLTQNQFDALVSFVFNVGPGRAGYKDGFLWLRNGAQSSMLRLLNDGNYMGAAQQFPNWVKSGGKTLAGLIRRRAAEKALFLSQQPNQP